MSLYRELKKEIAEKNKSSLLNKRNLIALEEAIYKDLIAENPCCANCPRRENLSLDHIVPKDMLKAFGVDVEREIIEGNYIILCKPCNQFKSNRLQFSIPQTKQILMKLLERI